MPPIRAVVFDLDGLMFNTEMIFDLSGNELMRRRGKVMTRECRDGMIGRRPVDAFNHMVRIMELTETIEALMEESREIFTGMLDAHLAPMPGLYELLTLVEERNLPKAVATSAPRAYMENILSRFELLDRFVFTLTAEDVTQGKPHPEIYQRAAENLNIDPQEMLVFEDSEAGTKAASAAGANVIVIPHEHTALQDLTAATLIAEHLHHPSVIQFINGA